MDYNKVSTYCDTLDSKTNKLDEDLLKKLMNILILIIPVH